MIYGVPLQRCTVLIDQVWATKVEPGKAAKIVKQYIESIEIKLHFTECELCTAVASQQR